MKLQNRKIQVQRHLTGIFGRETTTFDLSAIVIGSLSFAGLTLVLKWNANISIIEMILLTILALDIAGGVVANFTTGTNNYHAESLRKRHLFVLFHLLQPSILIWIFPNDLLSILCVSTYTLASSIVVLSIKKHYTQRIVAMTLLLLSFVLSTLMNYSDPLTRILMQLFSMKLILAYSVNWTSGDNGETRTEDETTAL